MPSLNIIFYTSTSDGDLIKNGKPKLGLPVNP